MTPPSTSPEAVRAWHARRIEVIRRAFRLKPKLTGSEWADLHLYLPADSPEPGRVRMSRVPHLREVLDAVCDPTVTRVVAMKGSQVGFSVVVIGGGTGYYIHQRPQPILIYQPTEDDAKAFSRTKLTGLIEASPVLDDLVGPMKSRDSGSTILNKSYPGGELSILWAVERMFRMRSAGVIFGDEIDAYRQSDEGDVIRLIETRQTAYRNPSLVLGSTPTDEDSLVAAQYEGTDQRKYHVPCPHCDHGQVMVWGGPDEDRGFKWDTELRNGRKVHVPGSVAYLCEHCHTLIEEIDKGRMLEQGVWQPTADALPGIRGYHLPQWLAQFPGTRWESLATKWDAAYDDPDELRAFMNHVKAEVWKERDLDFSAGKLSSRAERYPAEVPNGVGILTASCDVQHDRLELKVKGYGAGQESWLIGHHRLYGETSDPDVAPWTNLLHELTRAYKHESGAEVRIAATMIDAGDRPDVTYRFVKGLERRGIYAVIGTDARQKETLRRAKKANRHGVRPWTVDTFALKRTVYQRLKVDDPGPRFMHFCEPTKTGADETYFEQFGHIVWRRRKFAGKWILKPETLEGRADEAPDLEVYCLAALYSCGDPVVKRLGELAEALREGKAPETKRRRRRVRHRGVQ